MSIANLLTGDACSVGALYSHPMVEAVLGGSLHPGGLALTLDMCKGLGPNDHLLDVGCGKGTSARAVADATGCRVTGVDVSQESITEARRRNDNPRITFETIADLSDVSGPFTAILSECVLCLQGAPADNLSEYHRLLAPGGRLLLSDVTVEEDDTDFRSAAGFVACLGGAMPHAALLETVTAAGFDVTESASRRDLVQAVRDRIHSRVDVAAITDALGPQVTGLARLVDAAESALANGHLSYAAIDALRR